MRDDRMLPTAVLTKSGKNVDLVDPCSDDICIEDIAYSLARLVRFGGHVPGWNVAQHSVLASRMCAPEYALDALMHDAAEAYVGDAKRPLKVLLGDAFKVIEDRVEKAIASRFGLTYPCPTEVKPIDDAICRLELDYFWPTDVSPVIWCEPLTADESEELFLAEFKQLWKSRTELGI